MRRPGIVAPPGAPSDATLMLSWRPGAVTCYYNYLRPNRIFEYKTEHPDAAIIVRFQHPKDWFTDPEKSAVQYGQQIAARWNELRPLAPYVCFANELNMYYQNGDDDEANQPMYETARFYESAGWWITRTAQVIKSLAPDMNLITPPFAAGRHEDGSPDAQGNITEPFAGYDFLSDAIHAYFNDILAVHAYWGDVNGSDPARLKDPAVSSRYAFRWQRLLALCQARYNINAKIIIDEAGNYATYDPDFFEQITYFSRHTLTDPRVLALTFYIWEDPTFSPGNIFNVWTQYILDLPAFTQKLAAQPDIVPGAAPAPEAPPAATPAAIPAGATFDGPTIRVMFDDGRIEAMTLEQYLRAVVPAEIPASWHPEAVKAQAVAARSYAANAIRRARYLNKAFDIRANPDIDQNYRPDKIHPASDAAVLATAGLVLNYNNHPIDAVFSANCGGHTVNSEEVFKKKDGSPAPPTPYLRGVPCPAPGPKNGHGVGLCQHGANRFGQMGLTFDQILAHYYTGATLGRWTFDESAAAPTLAAVGDSPPQTWNLTIKRTPGFSIIVGNLADRPNVQISVTTPGGDSFVSLSGSKPEFGSGGFEAMAATPGTYTLEFLGQRFNVQMDGQTTARLEFSTAGAAAPAAPPAQSTLSGTLTDHRGAPLAGRTVRLQSAGGARTADTGPGGTYTFENLPAGTYNLSVPDTTISKTVTLDGREFKTVTLILAAAITSGGWTVDIQPRPGGLAFMVGDIGAANQPITVTAPGGAQTVTVSGSKPEYGPGGFEIYAPERGIYTLQFQDKTFTIPMEGQMLHLTFRPQAEAESQARLVSAPMPLSKAQTLLKQLTAQTGDGDAFKLEVI